MCSGIVLRDSSIPEDTILDVTRRLERIAGAGYHDGGFLVGLHTRGVPIGGRTKWNARHAQPGILKRLWEGRDIWTMHKTHAVVHYMFVDMRWQSR
jgi:hypothetical protein